MMRYCILKKTAEKKLTDLNNSPATDRASFLRAICKNLGQSVAREGPRHLDNLIHAAHRDSEKLPKFATCLLQPIVAHTAHLEFFGGF